MLKNFQTDEMAMNRTNLERIALLLSSVNDNPEENLELQQLLSSVYPERDDVLQMLNSDEGLELLSGAVQTKLNCHYRQEQGGQCVVLVSFGVLLTPGESANVRQTLAA